MKNECSLMLDLLPLYSEDMVSEESSEIIKEHLSNCPDCREKLSFLKETDDILLPAKEEIKPFKKILKKTNRQFNVLCYAVIILLLFIGVSFSDWGENMLKSIAVMPATGALGYVLFRYKTLYKLPLMLLVTEAFAFAINIIEHDFYMIGLNVALALLCILAGFLFAVLVHFIFRKDNKKTFLRIISCFVAIVLFSGICFLTTAVAGNPVSRILAGININEYVEKNFSGQGYEVTDIKFDYLSASYVASVEVPGSFDRHFSISAGLDGKVKDKIHADNSWLTENTADRIRSTYKDAVEAVFSNPDFQYPQASLFATIDFEENPDLYDKLEPDMQFNINEFGAKAGCISIEIWENNLTAEHAAEIMLHTKELLDKNGIEFYKMDCNIRNPDTENYEAFYVEDFLSDEIYEEGMIERVNIAGEMHI